MSIKKLLIISWPLPDKNKEEIKRILTRLLETEEVSLFFFSRESRATLTTTHARRKSLNLSINTLYGELSSTINFELQVLNSRIVLLGEEELLTHEHIKDSQIPLPVTILQKESKESLDSDSENNRLSRANYVFLADPIEKGKIDAGKSKDIFVKFGDGDTLLQTLEKIEKDFFSEMPDESPATLIFDDPSPQKTSNSKIAVFTLLIITGLSIIVGLLLKKFPLELPYLGSTSAFGIPSLVGISFVALLVATAIVGIFYLIYIFCRPAEPRRQRKDTMSGEPSSETKKGVEILHARQEAIKTMHGLQPGLNSSNENKQQSDAESLNSRLQKLFELLDVKKVDFSSAIEGLPTEELSIFSQLLDSFDPNDPKKILGNRGEYEADCFAKVCEFFNVTAIRFGDTEEEPSKWNSSQFSEHIKEIRKNGQLCFVLILHDNPRALLGLNEDAPLEDMKAKLIAEPSSSSQNGDDYGSGSDELVVEEEINSDDEFHSLDV